MDIGAHYLYSGERGRPRLIIPRNVLEYLIGNRFSVPQVAQLLQTSISTVRRRMMEFGIVQSMMNDWIGLFHIYVTIQIVVTVYSKDTSS